MNIRVRFTKEGEMRFVGHLDMMRYFQKAIRRAGIDVAYSEGFNPHQIISFASPLSLGMTSLGEYFDVRVNSSNSSEIMVEKLNAAMAKGVRVISWKQLPDGGKTNAMASLKASSYMVEFVSGFDFESFKSFASQSKIIAHKITKKTESDIDIRPLIYDFSLEDGMLKLLLAAGSEKSIKALFVLDEYYMYIKSSTSASEQYILGNINICRIDQYTGDDNLISLDDVGEII